MGSSRSSTVFDPTTGGSRVIENDSEVYDEATKKWWKRPESSKPEWNPDSPFFAGKYGGVTKKDAQGGRVAITKDDVYQLKDGTWLPTFGNDEVKARIETDKLSREAEAQKKQLETDRIVASQIDVAKKLVSRKRTAPKGGTILTSPLGVLGSSGSGGKTLIGA